MKPRIPQFIPQRDKKRIKKKLVPAAEWNKKMEDKYELVDPEKEQEGDAALAKDCLLYTSPSPRDLSTSRMPSSA